MIPTNPQVWSCYGAFNWPPGTTTSESVSESKEGKSKQDYTLNERYKTLPQALTFLPVVTDFHQQQSLFGGVFPSGNPVTVRQAPAHKTLSKHL